MSNASQDVPEEPSPEEWDDDDGPAWFEPMGLWFGLVSWDARTAAEATRAWNEAGAAIERARLHGRLH